MTNFTLLADHFPYGAALLVMIFALIIGSFLNVLIHRLPIMLDRQWQADYHSMQGTQTPSAPPYNLLWPPSSCPHCQQRLRLRDNIPLLSWCCLKGRCHHCHTTISARYPLVELLSALLSLTVYRMLGPTPLMLAALLFTWLLIALAFIDLDHFLLPDNLTLPLLWLGLLVNLADGFVSLNDAVIGTVSGYLVLWGLYWLFKLTTGKEGMGYGDFKLLAALGAWLGWQALPMILLISSLMGALIGIIMIRLGKQKQQNPIPFGPYLAFAGWIVLLWGDTICSNYLNIVL